MLYVYSSKLGGCSIGVVLLKMKCKLVESSTYPLHYLNDHFKGSYMT